MNDKLCPNIKFSERQNISDMDSIIEDVMTINMCLSREEQQREIRIILATERFTERAVGMTRQPKKWQMILQEEFKHKDYH